VISIVVVSWNSGEDLGSCLESLSAARARMAANGPPIELIVVDNHSEDFPEEEVRRIWPGARIAALSENVGFGPAVNHAAAHAKGEILLLVNPDARAMGDPFSPIARAFAEHPDWVAVAPRLVGAADAGDAGASPRETTEEESQEEFQLRKLPTLGQAFRELMLLDRAFPRSRARWRSRYLDRDRGQAFEVEQPAAAALAIRTPAFSALKGFDPRFVPAWWEDVDLCARLATLGKIVYYPESVFAHGGGASMKRLGYDRFLPVYYRNAVAYWSKHHGTLGTLLFRSLVAAGMVLRVLALPFRRRDPRPKRESFRAYRGAFRAAFS